MALSPYSIEKDGPDAVILRDYDNRLAVRLIGRAAASAERWLAQGWTPNLTDGVVDGMEVVPF